MQKQCPCWWEGPDGSRVLMMYTCQLRPGHAVGPGPELGRGRGPASWTTWQATRAATIIPSTRSSCTGRSATTSPLNARLAEVARQWNERYEYPKIILSPNAEFFEYIEKHYGDKLPGLSRQRGHVLGGRRRLVGPGNGPGRHAHEQTGQRARSSWPWPTGSAARASVPGRDEIYEAWRNCLLYDEHTWGAYCSISQPESEFTKAQWKIKAQFAVDAAQQARDALRPRAAGPGLAGANRRAGRWWSSTRRVGRGPTCVRVQLPEGMGVAEPGVPVLARTRTDTFAGGQGRAGLRLSRAEARRRSARARRARQPPTAGRPSKAGSIASSSIRPAAAITSIRDKELGQRAGRSPRRRSGSTSTSTSAGGNGTRIVMNPERPRSRN